MSGPARIYLDHAATTPVRRDVQAAMLAHAGEAAYNPSSLHLEGRRARALLDDARDRVAALLGAHRSEILFVAGGSEADNLALFGVAHALRERGRHLVSSRIEHHAVLHALDALREDGFEVTLLEVDRNGYVDVDAFAAALRPDTILASIMLANNEIGTLQPVGRLARLAHERGVLFHTDAVQAPPYIAIDVDDLGADLISLAAHKFYGPKGVGVLYVRRGVALRAILHGGSQEFGKRAGTENVLGAVGLATALELVILERSEVAPRVEALRDRLEAGVLTAVADARVNAREAVRVPHIASFSFAEVDSEPLVVRLDLEGIAVSAGSACASGVLEPSHVIAALGLDPGWQRGVLRCSLGRDTTAEEIDASVEALARVVGDLRGKNSTPA
ncbi:MAG: cysteine desulfurase family protein [Vulcanimicrobiaceae bacterium]